MHCYHCNAKLSLDGTDIDAGLFVAYLHCDQCHSTTVVSRPTDEEEDED